MPKPGVGYEVHPGAQSLAGGFQVTMDLTADPWAGRDPRTTNIDQTAMGKRYGPHWQAGVAGPHSNVYEDALRERFANRTATWPVVYEEWDGIPIGREVNDSFYTRDTKVTAPPSQTGTCEERLAKAQQDLAKAQHDLDASQHQVTDLNAQVQTLTAKVHKLSEVPKDIDDTVKILKEAGTHLEIKAGLKARFARLGKWVDERKA
jgi:hypothetical protein